jgi:hypothetical protein
MKPTIPLRLILTVFALMLCASCSDKSTMGIVDPPTSDVNGAINAFLPAYVSVASVQVDDAGQNRYKFKATATVQEPLYTLTSQQPDLSGVPPTPELPPPSNFEVLKPVNANGATIILYGHFSAEKIVDKWTYSDITFESGLEQLGKPAGSFPPGTVISGTPEAVKVLDAFTASVDNYKRKTTAILEQEKLTADKIKKEKDAEVAANRENLLGSFKAGASYKGVLTLPNGAGSVAFGDRLPNGTSKTVNVTVTSLTGYLVKADCFNPNDPTERQSFTGTLDIPPSTDSDPYPLTMAPNKSQKGGHGWDFFWAEGSLHLRPSSNGLEGTASMNGVAYALKLQRADGSTSNAPGSP